MDRKALVVLSGGQDSCTSLFWALKEFGGPENVKAVCFDYGQKHSLEVLSAQLIAHQAKVHLDTLTLVPGLLAGRSPLTNPGEKLETYGDAKQMEETIGDRIELTFVPMRNALFLTLAANRAICDDAYNLVAGVCQADNANYPDCRQVFIDAQQDAINKALGLPMGGDPQAAGQNAIKIHTPLMDLSKADSIKLAMGLPGCYAALALSHTAYSGEYPPETQDHATVLRADGFAKAGIPDPLIVRAWWEGLMPLPTADNYKKWQGKGLDHVGMNIHGIHNGELAKAMGRLELVLRTELGLNEPRVVEKSEPMVVAAEPRKGDGKKRAPEPKPGNEQA